MPATFSAIGSALTAGPELTTGAGAEAPPLAPCAEALPHFGQNAAPSAICVPQAEQNAIRTSLSDNECAPCADAANTCKPGLSGPSSSPSAADNNRVRVGRQKKNGLLEASQNQNGTVGGRLRHPTAD